MRYRRNRQRHGAIVRNVVLGGIWRAGRCRSLWAARNARRLHTGGQPKVPHRTHRRKQLSMNGPRRRRLLFRPAPPSDDGPAAVNFSALGTLLADFDATQIGTLFKTSAGTAVTADADPVG